MNKTRTAITVVRHGETEWNKLGLHQGFLDSPLTGLGIEQAQNVAVALRKFGFSSLYSSDLGRALQTAEIINRELNQNIIVDQRLRERNLGGLQGLTLAEFQEIYPEDFLKYSTRDPGYILPQGESIRQCYERSIACFEELAERHKNQNILIVTHGGILANIFRRVLEIPLDKKRCFSLKNCSINRFLVMDDEWKLESWGESFINSCEDNL
jgi:2,3-bisphosphoglycerate-dependent phosphoglycerate mutase